MFIVSQYKFKIKQFYYISLLFLKRDISLSIILSVICFVKELNCVIFLIVFFLRQKKMLYYCLNKKNFKRNTVFNVS